MKTRELSMGEKQAILKLREDGKINQSHCTNIDYSQNNYLECPEEETTGVLNNRRRIGRPRKTSAVDDRKHCESCKEKP